MTCLREVGARRDEADALHDLGQVCELLGDKLQAAQCLGQALLIWGQLDPSRAQQARRKLHDLQTDDRD